MRPIGVAAFGEVDEIISKSIAANILGYLRLETVTAPPCVSPGYALDKSRMQYNAGHILEAFETTVSDDYEKVIGVLDVDLFVPIMTYVFGEARQGGKCALVSLHRLKKNADGSVPARHLVLERTAKVALHELGHLFNLGHCRDEGCLMHFTGGIRDLDRTPPYFCRYCTIYLSDDLTRIRKRDRSR